MHRPSNFVAALRLAPVLWLFAPAPARGQATTPDGWTYTRSAETITLTRYTGTQTDVLIPSTIDGLPVRGLSGTFQDSRVVRRVTIPASVQLITQNPFWRAASLVAIEVVPDNPNYSALDGVLFDKTRSRLIAFPAGKPGAYTIPNTVRTLASLSFSYSAELTALRIPTSVTTIELTNLYECPQLLAYEVDPGSTSFSSRDGVLFNASQTRLISFPAGKGGSYTVPETVTALERESFLGARRLTAITLQSGVQSLGVSVFRGCTALIQVKLPSTLIALPNQAFMGCTSLEHLEIPDGCVEIGAQAFVDCSGLRSILFPRQVRTIPDGTFERAVQLESVIFRGNRPTMGAPFDGASRATIYHLAGATGWTSPVGTRPLATFTESSSALGNLSVRARLDRGTTLIVGAGTAFGPKRVLLRAAGPALAEFGLEGMPNPRLDVFSSANTLLVSNDDWPATLTETATGVGAFAFRTGSRDAALERSLGGTFTVHTSGSEPGVVLVEAYDTTGGSLPRLSNLSTRSMVGTGSDILIAGFAIAGAGTKQVLIRAVGPALTGFGVPGALADPRLEVFDSAGRSLAANDNWGTPVGSAAQATTATFAQVGAFPLAAGSRDAALLITLNAGASYTVQVAGVSNTTGEALIEVYEVF